MAVPGRISLLIDSPLSRMLLALRTVPEQARKQAQAYANSEGGKIWTEETRDRAGTRLEQRVLVDSARVGVTARNITLRAGGVGNLSSGTPVSLLANAAEYGMGSGKEIATKSRKGTPYTRRVGASFRAPTRRGYVFNPAVRDAIPRITSVIIQSVRRSLFDALDGKR